MKNMKIFNKLICGFLIVSILTTVVGAVGIISMLQMKNSSTKLYEKQTVPLPVISDLILNLDRLRGVAKDYIIYADDEQQLKNYQDKINTYKANYENDVKEYEPTISTAETKALFQQASKIYKDEFVPALDDIKQEIEAKNLKDAIIDLDNYKTVNQKLQDIYNQCMDNRIKNAKANNDSNNQLADMMIIILIIVVVVSLLISLVLGYFIARALSRPINEMAFASDEKIPVPRSILFNAAKNCESLSLKK
jgi:methyl-accepting chemotaxis protein